MTTLDKDLMKLTSDKRIPRDDTNDGDNEFGAESNAENRGDPHCYECKVW